MLRTLALPLVALLLTGLAHAADKPQRIVSTTPSVTGILLAINAPVIATAAAAPSRLTDAKGFFRQWAEVADQRAVQVLYPNLQFDLEAVIGWAPDLLVVSATGADSVLQHQAELEAQGINSAVVTIPITAGRKWPSNWARSPGWSSRRRLQSSASMPTP